jgi:hypothetical protein
LRNSEIELAKEENEKKNSVITPAALQSESTNLLSSKKLTNVGWG